MAGNSTAAELAVISMKPESGEENNGKGNIMSLLEKKRSHPQPKILSFSLYSPVPRLMKIYKQ